MVYFMPFVPDRHDLEQTTICAQDAVGQGVHPSSSVAHAPRPAVPQPRILPWEEVPAQIFHPHYGHVRRNLLVQCPPLWGCQVGIKTANHQ